VKAFMVATGCADAVGLHLWEEASGKVLAVVRGETFSEACRCANGNAIRVTPCLGLRRRLGPWSRSRSPQSVRLAR